MLITDIISYLQTHEALVPLVAGRVQAIPAPPDLDQYPCITVQGASFTPVYTGDGDAEIPTQRLVFDCLATQSGSPAYLNARALAETLGEVLSGLSGDIGSSHIESCFIANIADRWDDGSHISCSTVHALITTN